MNRRIAVGLVVAVVGVIPNGPVSAGAPGGDAPRVCTWGGTPTAPTGTVELKPGLTNTPATDDVKILATGPAECSDGFEGEVTFDGVIQAGGTCSIQVFEGKVKGLPGVERLFGPGAATLVSEFMFDKDGNVVGADQPQVASGFLAGGSDAGACNTEDGFTETVFSSTVELWG